MHHSCLGAMNAKATKGKELIGNNSEVALNKRARFEYEILETLEAGIVLSGTEVKSLRKKQVTITEAFARINNSQAFIINMVISHYSHGNIFNHEPSRERKLLLHKSEIIKLQVRIKEKGLTLVPLKVYFNDNGKAKVLLGVAKGKNLYDKRQDMREKDTQMDIQRALKKYNR